MAADSEHTRIVVLNTEKCQPSKCSLQCKRKCPVNTTGKLCIEVTPTSKLASISESLCIGCGICCSICPFNAITIVNIPKNLSTNTTHRYNANSFKLHGNALPKEGSVLGLVGKNGIGKSTCLQILAGKIIPNLGKIDDPPDWKEILLHYRGTRAQPLFSKISSGKFKSLIKPQYVDLIGKTLKAGKVRDILESMNERKKMDEIIDKLDLKSILDRSVDELSGGESQRFAIAILYNRNADMYLLDEPSSFLDIKQRLKAGAVIRELAAPGTGLDKYVVVAEHDLCLLDYMADEISVLFGKQMAYGVVSTPSGVRDGINEYLAGYLKAENMRFREFELSFRIQETVDEKVDLKEDIKDNTLHRYGAMTKSYASFKLTIEPGSFKNSEITLLLGENGTGKTTFVTMLAGLTKPDVLLHKESLSTTPDTKMCTKSIDQYYDELQIPQLNISHKPQKIVPKFTGDVRSLFHTKIQSQYTNPLFISEVIKPLGVDKLYDRKVQELSGGELQICSIVLCLGKPADLYLLDEPSTYLDCEQRLVAAKVIKRFIMSSRKSAFVVEHDFLMSTYLGDQSVYFSGVASKCATAHSPKSMVTGMNAFLKQLDVTFRRDTRSHRPRINKKGSIKDMEQKRAGTYFYIDDTPDVDEE